MSEDGIVTSSIENASKPPSPIFSLPGPIQTLLGYAGFAYAVGFITLVANTARYGTPVLEFVKPLNLWVGAFPTLVILAAAFLFRKWRAINPNGGEISLRRVALDLLGISAVFCLYYMMSWACIWVLMKSYAWVYGSRLQQIPLAVWMNAHMQTLTLLLTTALFIPLSAREAKDKGVTLTSLYARKEYLFHYVLTSLTAAILASYIWLVYPLLPQEYGFGRPIEVRLLVDADCRPLLPLVDSSAPLSIERAGAGAHEVRLTHPVELLFKTEKEYVLRYRVSGESKVVSIDSASVKGTIWR